jgi:hypothetical protein
LGATTPWLTQPGSFSPPRIRERSPSGKIFFQAVDLSDKTWAMDSPYGLRVGQYLDLSSNMAIEQKTLIYVDVSLKKNIVDVSLKKKT